MHGKGKDRLWRQYQDELARIDNQFDGVMLTSWRDIDLCETARANARIKAHDDHKARVAAFEAEVAADNEANP